MLNKIKNEIRIEYRKSKLTTAFMLSIFTISILSYLKPSSTSGILNYIGITAMNFIFLSALICGIWYFWWRKNGKK